MMKTRTIIICAMALLCCLGVKAQNPFKNLKKSDALVDVTFNGNSPTIVDFLTSYTKVGEDELRFVVAEEWDKYLKNKPLSQGVSFYVDQKSGYIRFDLDFDVAYPDEQLEQKICVEYCYWNCSDGTHKLFAENVGSIEKGKPAYAPFDGLYVYAYDNATEKLYEINQDLLGLDDEIRGKVTYALPKKGKDIDVFFHNTSKTTQGTLVWNGNGFSLSKQSSQTASKSNSSSSSSNTTPTKSTSSSSSNKANTSSNNSSSTANKSSSTSGETGSDSGSYDKMDVRFSNCWIELAESENMIKYHFDMNVTGGKGQSVMLLTYVEEQNSSRHKDKKGNEIKCEATYQIHYNNSTFKDKWLGISLNNFNPLPGTQKYFMEINAYHGTRKNILGSPSTYLSFTVSGDSKPMSSPKNWSKMKQGTSTICSGESAVICMAAKDGKMANGTNIGIYGNSIWDEQSWYFEPAGDGSYYICSATNHDYVLDVTKGVAADGTNVQLYKRNNTKAQRWFFEKCHTAPNNPKEDHDAYIIHTALNTNFVLDMDNSSNILIRTNYGSLSQKWRIDDL